MQKLRMNTWYPRKVFRKPLTAMEQRSKLSFCTKRSHVFVNKSLYAINIYLKVDITLLQIDEVPACSVIFSSLRHYYMLLRSLKQLPSNLIKVRFILTIPHLPYFSNEL